VAPLTTTPVTTETPAATAPVAAPTTTITK
jgi:hypothetical protein